MPEKMPTYRIDESLLRSKMLGYQVEVNASRCEAIEQEIAQLKFKKTISLPNINYRIVAPVVLVAALLTIVFFNLDAINDLFRPSPEIKNNTSKVSIPVSKPTVAVNAQTTPTVAVSQVPTPTLANLPPPVQNVMADKADTATSKKSDTSKQENAKKPNPVLAQPPSDSVAKTTEVNKQDTSVQRSGEPVKKKKKRRRRNANMDELKKSTLQSNSADDEVVVPQ